MRSIRTRPDQPWTAINLLHQRIRGIESVRCLQSDISDPLVRLTKDPLVHPVPRLVRGSPDEPFMLTRTSRRDPVKATHDYGY